MRFCKMRKKVLILIIAGCLYVGLFAYGMYNKYKPNDDATSNPTTIPAETQPSVIEITQDNFYDYFYLECEVANFNKTSGGFQFYFSDKEYWYEDGTADLQISIGQKVQGKINNVTVSIEAWSETNTWETKEPYTESIVVPITGVVNKTIPVDNSESGGYFVKVNEPVFEIRIIDVSGTIELDNSCLLTLSHIRFCYKIR